YLPPIQDPVYGYEAVNVEAQLRDASSLLNWTRRMLAVRRSTQVFGRGRITMLHPGNRKILAYLLELGDEAVLCVANISRMAQPVELDLARFKGRVPVEMSGHNAFPSVGELPYLLTLPSYGFYWFRLATDTAPPDWSTQRLPVEDLAVLVLFDGWNSLFRDRVVPWRIAMAIKTMAQFEGDLLPRFLARQRWFAGAVAGRAPPAALPAPVQVADHAVFAHDGREWLLCLLEGSPAAAATPEARWFAPFAVAWEDGEEERLRQLGPAALAKVRMQAQVGVMADAFADEAFCRAVVVALGAGKTLRSSQGTLHFQPTGAFVAVAGSDSETQTPLRPLPQSRGTVLALDDRLLFKAPRRVRPGLSVELEMGRVLTDVARFEHSVPMFGSVEHVAADGTPSLLLLLQAWVPNQGDAWALGVEQLARQLERMAPLEAAGVELADNGGLLARVRLLAQRTAELHAALAQVTGQPAFDPEPVQAADLQHWVQQLRERAAATLDLLRARLQAQPQAQPQARPQATPEALPEALPPALRATAQRLLDAGVAGFEPGLARVAALPPRGLKTRVHGGYRLQEVLLVNNDFVIIDFEGDPERPLQERRAKQSPLCDVAGMLRSFDQARQAALALGSPSETEAARRVPLAQAWGEAVRSAFVQGYGQAAVAAGLYADADDFAAARPLLELFEADLAWQQLHDELSRLPEGGVALPGALALLAGWLPPGA
ncbi:MAG TPA: alpha-glucosidase C-terminal domain-containing protein, partial [Rubrivivax sp.]|nr:alpha-glucosidase C-terminal domain-containing protein [Rubrivivax sp.]